jgi:hypothetical protein
VKKEQGDLEGGRGMEAAGEGSRIISRIEDLPPL